MEIWLTVYSECLYVCPSDCLSLMLSPSTSPNFRFETTSNSFNWSVIKAKRDAYVKRLNGIYANNLANDKIEHLHGWGRFTEKGRGEFYGLGRDFHEKVHFI